MGEKQPLAWGLRPSLLEASSVGGRLCSRLALGLSRAWPLAQRSHFAHPPHLPGTSWTPGRPEASPGPTPGQLSCHHPVPGRHPL